MNKKPTNDNSSPARDKAEQTYSAGKSPRQTRDDLSKQKAKENVKPVKPTQK
jgi:hypothetical protein